MEKNYEVLAEINTTPSEALPTWADLGVMFKNISQSLNEVLYQASYLKDKGWGSSEVTGGQFTVAFTGDKKPGDAVNDYIFNPDIQYKFGEARKTQLRLTYGLTAITWGITMTNITDAGGDANQPNAVTLTIHGNGAPSIATLANAGARLESLAVGTLILTPSFASGQFGYSASTTAATSVITAVAEAVGAVIAIKVDGVVVANGAAATWELGVNVVIITVTNGALVSTYTVVVTKTA